jgi:hypothetical protein
MPDSAIREQLVAQSLGESRLGTFNRFPLSSAAREVLFRGSSTFQLLEPVAQSIESRVFAFELATHVTATFNFVSIR